MKIGYARVSTIEQNLDRQIIALQEAGCDVIYQEKITGTKIDRPELKKMLAELQEGDIVMVKELTRVSRSTLDMLDLVQQITAKGCYIKSLSENWLDTASPTGELMLTLMAGIAQFERRLLLQRCAEGREVAVAKGVKMGRPKTGGKQMDFAIELYRSKTMSIRKICESTGVSKATLCRRLKELGLTSQST
ncbi:recombinase family protein [Clostridium sp. DJ247]|uniref:recombinase family protein n=1 Tax=Clostridium sp. DJ247 TaxID=2726188 RepID=UPI001625E85F|nr:recombinase family protein [Clostridium sp. DJ247]MBC2579705.1 recombinase family protein [Clostridium sp. DJ247]